MLLEQLAAHPTVPDSVLTQLLTIATAHDPDSRRATPLRRALAANPRTSPEQVRALAELTLAEGALSVLTTALRRPGADVDFALEVLEQNTSATALAAAVTEVSDPIWRLAEHALAVSPTPSVMAALLDLEDVPAHLLWAAIDVHANRTTHIATRIQARIVAALTRLLLRATTPEAHAALVEQVRALRAGTAREDFAGRLDRIDLTYTSPEPGTPRWYASEQRTVGEVLTYLEGRSAAAWKSAVRNHRDPTGRLTDAALVALRPGASSRSLMALIIGDKQHSMPARQRALLALAATGAPLPALSPWLIGLTPTDLAVEFVVTLARNGGAGASPVYDGAQRRLTRPSTYLPSVLSRDDLTSAHLDALAPLVAAAEARNGVTAYSWGIYLATHPAANDAQRAAGRAHLSGHPDHARVSPRGRDLADLVTTFTDLTGDDASAARCGALLNVGTLSAHDLGAYPGLRWLLSRALDHLVPDDDALVTVLVQLAAGARGTLGDLIATARAVTA